MASAQMLVFSGLAPQDVQGCSRGLEHCAHCAGGAPRAVTCLRACTAHSMSLSISISMSIPTNTQHTQTPTGTLTQTSTQTHTHTHSQTHTHTQKRTHTDRLTETHTALNPSITNDCHVSIITHFHQTFGP